MIGAYKARVAPFNVNYRYVEDELLYLLARRADRAASSTTPASRPRLARILPKLPPLALLLQVDDGSGDAAPARARATTRRRWPRRAMRRRRSRRRRRRPLHRLHRRHDRHAEGRALAPGATSSSPRWAGACPGMGTCDEPRRDGRARAERRHDPHPAGAAVHARRRRSGRRSSSCTQGGTVIVPSNTRASIPTTSGARSSARRVGTVVDRRRRLRAAAARSAPQRHLRPLGS